MRKLSIDTGKLSIDTVNYQLTRGKFQLTSDKNQKAWSNEICQSPVSLKG